MYNVKFNERYSPLVDIVFDDILREISIHLTDKEIQKQKGPEKIRRKEELREMRAKNANYKPLETSTKTFANHMTTDGIRMNLVFDKKIVKGEHVVKDYVPLRRQLN